MRWPRQWNPFAGIKEAKRHLEESKAARLESEDVTEDIRELRAENHITARVHAAMRGGRA